MFKVKVILALAACAMIMGTSSQGCNNGGTNNDSNPVDAPGMFEKVWTDVNENYAYFAQAGVDWDAVKATYQGQFTGEMTEAQFLAALAPMLAELKDPSVSLTGSDGKAVTVYTAPAAANYPSTFKSAHFSSPSQMSSSQLDSGKLPAHYATTASHITYWAIDNLNFGEWTDKDGYFSCLRDLDAVLQKETLTNNDGLIIDLRQTAAGGDRRIAEILAAYFTSNSVLYGYTKDRTVGSDRAAFKDFDSHSVTPITGLASSEIVFTSPVVVLTGQKTQDGAEWFAIALGLCPNVTVMGDKTGGSCGALKEFSLSSGVKYRIPVAQGYFKDKTLVEGVGLAPDVAMAPADSVDAAGEDLLLDAAWDKVTQ